jgi:hypothetical protein
VTERSDPRGYTAELPPQGEPAPGQELIRVRYQDGSTEELRLHNYARVYSIPGLYERIVSDRLGCRSPNEIASMLADAVDQAGWERAQTRVIDLAAGNGVSGAALAAYGLRPVLGIDIVPEAREAALRDHPQIYDSYVILDLLALSPEQKEAIRALRANALACVAPVGNVGGHLPPAALAAAARLMAPDALIAYYHDPAVARDDGVTPELFGPEVTARELQRRPYVHRYTAGGRPFEVDGVVWRVQPRQPG